jgi:chitinase
VTSPVNSCDLGTNYDVCNFRVLNNKWGTEEIGAQAEQCIFVNQDGSYGWNWNRGDVGSGENPNFPQVEFGINPWGREQDPWEELPSSTDALPLQIRDIQSASMTLRTEGWVNGRHNLTFETWLVDRDPRTGAEYDGSSIVAELMAFFSWTADYWPETPEASGSFSGSGPAFNFWVNTAWDEWQYFQARISSGALGTSVNTSLDIKAYLDWAVSQGYSQDLWVARFEVGNEIFPNSSGETTIREFTIELNGETYTSVNPL